MEIPLRRFNSKGIEEFRVFLTQARTDSLREPPRSLLEKKECSEIIATHSVNKNAPIFTTRREAADYLFELLNKFNPDEIRYDRGLWSWLSLYFFDSVCPADSGHRMVRNDYTYIFDAKGSRYFYRHLLFVGWYAKSLTPHSRIFLDNPLNSLDKVTEAVMKRLFLLRIPCIFQVIDQLYWDTDNNRPKKGIADGSRIKRGDLGHRLPQRIRQLEKTYDLVSLSAEQLIELLGKEFQI